MPWPIDTSRPAERFARLQANLARRYRLERELGLAGPTTGYLARDLASDRPVALKLLDPSRAAAAGSARVLRELWAAARAEHQHILGLLDAGVVPTEAGETVYYTVPFLAGESLRARLDRELQLPVADALAIAEDVAAGLGAAHAVGVAHGALASESVVLAGGQALLADLGVAAALGGEPPDPRDDIHGLGRLLYEMLSGAPPDAGAPTPLRAGRAGIPEEVELTVAQLLAPPGERYRTAEEARNAIRGAAAAARASSLPGASTAERAALRRHLPARWGVFALAVAGLLGLSLWLRYSIPVVTPAQPPPARPGSLAVLPFVNATPDTANLLLSDGFTRELTGTLGRIPGLRVAGAGSAYALGRRTVDPRRAGERLGVDAVLRGTVRPFEGRLRIRASLTHAREGFDLWSETYDRDVTELAAVQREIASAVAGVLRLPAEFPPTAPVPADAQHAYLRAVHGGGLSDSARIGLLEEAVRLDSAFAPAWAALGRAWLCAGARDSLTPEDVAVRAREAAQRALTVNSGLPEAHAVLGEVAFGHDWDWAAAEASLRRSLALNPNQSETRLRLAQLLLATGRVDESVEAGRDALELSPFDPAVRLYLARQALHLGDYVRAAEELDLAVSFGVDSTVADLLRGRIAAVTGRLLEAIEPLERAAAGGAGPDEARAMLGWVYALAGRRDEAHEIRADLQQAAESRYVSPYQLAYLADALGDRRAAFGELDRAVTVRTPELVDLRIDSRMDRLRADRRFNALARRVGLP